MTDATGMQPTRDGTVAGDLRIAEHRKARRRLILAAGAVLPSIYTLSSGAQTAAASNLACWAKQPTPPPVRFTTAPDNWYRAEVYVGDHKGGPAYCVSDRQDNCIGPALGSHEIDPTGGSANEGREGSVWVVDGTRGTAGPALRITNVRPAPKSYGLVYVNQEGTISTLDPTFKANLNPVAGSCWTSILGGRISQLG